MALAFLKELTRRRVLRTASYYVVGAWVLLQVADILFPALELPESAIRYLLFALSIGFPLALVAGWFFDVTPTGIRRTGPATEALPELSLRDYGALAIVVFVAGAVIYSAWPERPPAFPVAGAVAVMPFSDDAGDTGEPIGESLSIEVIGALKRVPGIWVPGPDSSFRYASRDPVVIGQELRVGAVLDGRVRRKGEEVEIVAELIGAGDGRRVWKSSFAGPVTELIKTQAELVKAVISSLSPSLDMRPTKRPSADAEACAGVYDRYLRARHLSRTDGRGALEVRAKGVDLLREAVAEAPDCALAWAGLATAHFAATPQFEGADRFERGLASAAAAARRALELDDGLAEAWIILAEKAEQDGDWIASEDFFLKALYADPTDPRANAWYSETLAARGRVRDALHYALEAYRYDPASREVAFKVALAAKMSGDADRAIEFGTIMGELSERAWYDGFFEVARGHMLKGEVERAVEIYQAHPEFVPEWFLGCARAQSDPELLPQAKADVASILTAEGALEKMSDWPAIICGTWIEEADLVVDALVGLYGRQISEGVFMPFFFPEAAALRRHPGFRQLAVDSGLLEYWRAVAWSDYCRSEDGGFRCD